MNTKIIAIGKVKCRNKHVDEGVLYKAFVSSFNALVENREEFIEKWKAMDGDELGRYRAKEFIGLVEAGKIDEFDMDLYFRMIEKMVVFEDRVIIGLLDGTEVECIIE